MIAKVVIAGRTNVGKSSLFNKLVGRRFALTNNSPHVTRDSLQIYSTHLNCYIVDTAGIDESESVASFVEQAKKTLVDAQIVLFVVDGKVGVLPEDRRVLAQIRSANKNHAKIVLVINKVDCASAKHHDCQELGLGMGIRISAEHSIGLDQVQAMILSVVSRETNIVAPKHDLNIALIGQPNAGKSSLINRLLGYERVCVSDIAGTTREAIDITFKFNEYNINIIDNAGTRRRYSRDKSELENMSFASSINAIERSDVVILVMDAAIGAIHSQDLRLASMAMEKLKPLIIAANKCDVATELKAVLEKLQGIAKDLFLQSIVVPISANTGYGCKKLISEAIKHKTRAQRKISIQELNDWLAAIEGSGSSPSGAVGSSRIKRIVQCSNFPQIFNLYINTVKDRLGQSHERYLVKNLRKTFDLHGIPIVLRVITSKNPYLMK